MTAPLSLADEIAQHVEAFGGTEEAAAAVVCARRARRTELAESTDPAVLLPEIRDALRLTAKIERVVKVVGTPATYRLDTDRGPVLLGTAKQWATRPAEFSAAFLDIGEMPTLPKGPRRNELCTMIARAAEPEDIGEEATDAGWTRGMLTDYLGARPPVDTAKEAATSEYPFTDDDGRVVLFGQPCRRWILLTYQQPINATEFGKRLRLVGGEPDKINVEDADGKRTSRSVWRLPAKFTE